MEAAATHLERALSYVPEHGMVRAHLAHAYLHAAHLEAATADAARLVSGGSSPPERLWGLHVLADCAWRRGHLHEALAHAERGVELLATVPETDLPRGVHAVFASIFATQGRTKEARALVEPRLAVVDDPLERAYNVLVKGFILDRADATEEAWACYREVLEEAERLEARHLEVHAAAFATFAASVLGRHREGRELAERALAHGTFQYTPLLKTHLAKLELTLGRPESALRLTEEVVESGEDQLVGLAWAYRVEALAALGRNPRSAVEEALVRLGRTDFPNTRAAIVAAVLAHGARKQHQRALRHAERIPLSLVHRFYRQRLEQLLPGR
jgi:tetratricopeptide (TPR) repeat protein